MSTLSTICLSMPVATASVEGMFSQMKYKAEKLHWREKSFKFDETDYDQITRKLSDNDLDNRKRRRIAV